jgi:hypothetical protein
MLETFTAATFDERAGAAMAVATSGGVLAVELVEVRHLQRRSHPPDGVRAEPFALTFAGPLDPQLTQGTYRVELDDLGAFELFLVPVGPQGDAMHYEATFG